ASQAFTGAMVTSTGVLRIGGNSIWGEYFTGRVDDIRIYNQVLTASAIQTDMNTPVTPAAGGSAGIITIEAESMSLTQYQIENNANASGGRLISRLNATGASPGVAKATFPGPAGLYDVTVAYFDENDGQCTLKFLVNGTTVDTWVADDDLPSGSPD